MKIKYLIVGIILGLLFGSVGVYATLTYNASQITYTKNNVEMPLSSAIDDLYTTQTTTINSLSGENNSLHNKFDTLTLYLTGVSYSQTKIGRGLLSLSTLKNNYSKYKILSKTILDGYDVTSCDMYSNTTSGDITLYVNTEYSSANARDIKINVKAKTEGSAGACRAEILFYN